MRKVQKMKRGGVYPLSAAQIAMLIVNMLDAKKNLPPEQFERVNGLFLLFQQETEQANYGYEAYLEKAADIASRFNHIAPYQYYSGAGTVETLLLVEAFNKIDFSREDFLLDKMTEQRKQLWEEMSELKREFQAAQNRISGIRRETIFLAQQQGKTSREEMERDLQAFDSCVSIVQKYPGQLQESKNRMQQLNQTMTSRLTGC